MILRPNAKFCSDCGNAITHRIPEGDSRERDCCDACGAIHYLNPRPVVGTIPVWEDQILLCRRAIEPRHGYWTLPAGFMEVGETVVQGAQRETMEEANANVEMGPLFTMIDVPGVEQIHIYFRARLLDLNFGPGTESLDVRLFREDEINWEELSFRSVSATLRFFFADRARGHFGVHTHALPPLPVSGIE